MRWHLASSGAHPERGNEDVVVALPHALVLLDGAGMGDIRSICAHGVRWFTLRLGSVLVNALADDDGRSLSAILAEAIEQVADAHRGTCDLADPRSPNAAVALLRVGPDAVESLVLGDIGVGFDRQGQEPLVIVDDREPRIGREVRAAYAAAPPGSEQQEVARAAAVALFAATRNQPGGFWMARDDPRAAGEALVHRHDLSGLAGVGAFSNGVSRLVAPWAVTDWSGLFGRLRTGEADGVLATVRVAEAERGESPDDATVAYAALD